MADGCGDADLHRRRLDVKPNAATTTPRIIQSIRFVDISPFKGDYPRLGWLREWVV
jgi:hypothetical protein